MHGEAGGDGSEEEGGDGPGFSERAESLPDVTVHVRYPLWVVVLVGQSSVWVIVGNRWRRSNFRGRRTRGR